MCRAHRVRACAPAPRRGRAFASSVGDGPRARVASGQGTRGPSDPVLPPPPLDRAVRHTHGHHPCPALPCPALPRLRCSIARCVCAGVNQRFGWEFLGPIYIIDWESAGTTMGVDMMVMVHTRQVVASVCRFFPYRHGDCNCTRQALLAFEF